MAGPAQIVDSSNWNVELSNEWDVLGPFPIHAREQHFLSPSFPVNLSEPIDLSKSWPSSYADGGEVSWTSAQADGNGTLKLSFPEVRWKTLRATEGWAALQYHSILRTVFVVHPPHTITPSSSSKPPHLLVRLIKGSYFTVIPSTEPKETVPAWYAGNIYDLDSTLPQTCPLPTVPSVNAPTKYYLFVSGDYEIRLFGDPRSYNCEAPTLSINIGIKMEPTNEDSVKLEPSQDVVADFVDGWAFGNAFGVGLRSISGWWNVTDISLNESVDGLTVTLLHQPCIAPSQTRIIPIQVSQSKSFHHSELRIGLTIQSESRLTSIHVVLPIRQMTSWTLTRFSPIQASYFYAESNPTAFLVIPPKKRNERRPYPPLLALHGAGVDILHDRFFVNSLARQNHSWIILPTGRTSWGLDWHGPSAQDAWHSLDALISVVDRNILWHPWKLQANSPTIVLGHSNGGQGAWYLASRFPDRVIGVVAAAGYIKSQAYVPLTQSRSSHFIDPALQAILESSLTPDDNDLFFSNLVSTSILAIHGSDDDNVPTWHSRESVEIIRSWSSEADVTFVEDANQPHWYPSVLNNEIIQSFLDRVIAAHSAPKVGPTLPFTLTVAIPAESGSLHGWRIESLSTPGRVARLHVKNKTGLFVVTAHNVHSFTIDLHRNDIDEMFVNGAPVFIVRDASRKVVIEAYGSMSWQSAALDSARARIQPSGRIQNILKSRGPLQIIIPDETSSHEMCIALRIAHDLNSYHRLDAEIIQSSRAVQRLQSGALGPGNIIAIEGIQSSFSERILSQRQTSFGLQDMSLTLRDRRLGADQGILFLHPHPSSPVANVLFLFGNGAEARERAARLSPLRTGVTIPDWLVVSADVDVVGAGGVKGGGVWGRNWSWNDPVSWLY